MAAYALVENDRIANVIEVEPDVVDDIAAALEAELVALSELPEGAWLGWVRADGQWTDGQPTPEQPRPTGRRR